jgi:AraC family L-rhamnose operon transcriptional activator RhaR
VSWPPGCGRRTSRSKPTGPGARSIPSTNLARLRAENAATLLLHTDQPVTCIGHAVGWPDQNYFARRFKAHYGLAATTYRARFAGHAAFLER